jgi:hypothetical protein
MRHAKLIAIIGIIFLFPMAGESIGADTGSKKAAAEETKAVAAVQQMLDRKLPEIRFNNNSLSDVIDFLRDVAGANIYVDWKSLESVNVAKDSPVTYSATDTKFGDVLNAVLANAAGDPKKLVYCTDGGIIFVSTPDVQKQHRDLWKTHRDLPTDKLKSFKPIAPEVRFNANNLSDVIDFLRDTTGDNFRVDWDQMAKNGIEKDTPITLRIRNAQTLMVYQMIADSASNDKSLVDYKIDGDTIEFFSVSKKQK